MLDKLRHLRSEVLGPFAIRIPPNHITFLSLLSAFGAGWFFWQSSLALGALFTFFTAFFAVLDGEIARRHRLDSRVGAFFAKATDRIVDIVILLGLTFSPLVPDILGFGAIISILLVDYLDTQARVLAVKYKPFFGRGDRLMVVILGALAFFVYDNALMLALVIIIALSILSFLETLIAVGRKLR